MRIIRASKEDIAQLCLIEKEYDGYACWGEAGFLAEFSKPFSLTMKAKLHGKIAGFINFWILKPQVEINTLVVSKNFLRKGIASALLLKAQEYAVKNDCLELLLEVCEINYPAISLYRSFGFEKIFSRPKYYNSLYDAMVMSKRIKI